MSEYKLKPCPFCGSHAELREVRGNGTGKEVYWNVRCANPACPGRILKSLRNRDEIVRLWNRRFGA